jgi:hypothetical protein
MDMTKLAHDAAAPRPRVYVYAPGHAPYGFVELATVGQEPDTVAVDALRAELAEARALLSKLVDHGDFYGTCIELDFGVDGRVLGRQIRALVGRE